MFGDLSSFVWQAPAEPGVFAWQNCEADDQQPSEYRGLVRQEGGRMRAYHPLAGTLSLYVALAKVEPTEASVLEFVQCYGPLGQGVETSARTTEGRFGDVEPLPAWRR